jgi:ABC-type transporter Mla maintaining outer membrane lipid asymmetry permease subunit MlaE
VRRTANRVVGAGALLIALVTFVGAVSGHQHATWVRLVGAILLAVTIVAGLAIRCMGPRTRGPRVR